MTYFNSAEPRLSSEPNLFARKRVLGKGQIFLRNFFYDDNDNFGSYDWRFSFLMPDGIPDEK